MAGTNDVREAICHAWCGCPEHFPNLPRNRVTAANIGNAVDEWYSANYPMGVRLRFSERRALANFIAQRLGLEVPPSAASDPVSGADDGGCLT